jgi:hypothetical protein
MKDGRYVMKSNPMIAALVFASLAFTGSAFACEDRESSAAVKEPAVLASTTVAATKKPTAVASEKGSRDAPPVTAATKKPAVAKKPIVVAGGQQ